MSIIIPSNFEQSTYEIDINKIKSKSYLGVDNVIYEIDYKLTTIVNENRISQNRQIYFPLETMESIAENHISYSDITKEQVIEWVEEYAPILELRYSQCRIILEQAIIEEEQTLPWEL